MVFGIHIRLRDGVQGRGGFVQDHEGGVLVESPGQHEPLGLPAGEGAAQLAHRGVVALGQAGDEIVGVGQLRRFHALLVGGAEVAIADIVHDRSCEQISILQDDPQRPPEVGLADFVDIDVIIADFAVGNVVKPVDKVGNGGFARAGCANKGDLLARLGVKGHIVQNRFIRGIAKIHLFHGDIPLQPGVGHGTLRLMGVLPRPDTRVLRAFGEIAFFVQLCVYQGHITAILLAFLVHQLKNALRTGHGHNNGVNLVAHMTNGHLKRAGKKQKAHQRADGKHLLLAGNGEKAANNSQNCILQIP